MFPTGYWRPARRETQPQKPPKTPRLAHKRVEARRGGGERNCDGAKALFGRREPGNAISARVLDRALAGLPTPRHRKNPNKVLKWYRFGTRGVYNLLI